MARLVFTLALFMHGVGHILFVANAWGYWQTDRGDAWLFDYLLHLGQTTEGVLGLLWLVPLTGFLIGTWGFYTNTAGWQSWLLASSAVSSVLLLLWWGSVTGSSALFALLFNLLVITIVLWQPEGILAP